jgi:hypothetical protein
MLGMAQGKRRAAKNRLRVVLNKIRDSQLYRLLNDASLVAWILKVAFPTIVGMVEAAMHMPPLRILVDALAFFGVIAIVFPTLKEKTVRQRVGALGVLLVSGLIITATWWLSGIKIYGPFKAAASRYEAQLGAPKSPPIRSKEAVEAVFDNAAHVWIEQDHTFWFFPQGAAATKWVQYPEAAYCANSPDFYDFSKLRAMFPDVPKGKEPPWGGVACNWLSNPPAWEWLGWMHWQCLYHRNAVVEQEFAHGKIIGVVHAVPGDNTTGTVFVILDDGSWHAESVNVSPPACE